MKTVKIPVCPAPGQGVNKWTFKAALILCRLGWSAETIRAFLHEHTRRTGAEADAEIERAVERAPLWPKGQAASVRHWPPANPSLIHKIIVTGFNLEQLRAVSQQKCNTTEQVLDVLFPGDPLIWVADSVAPETGSGTFPLSKWRLFARSKQFIVPNPMTSSSPPADRKSSRCLANTGPRRFLVIERDQGTLDEQAAILWHLARFEPLALVVHSAGKSLHGWFYVENQTEEQSREFMEYAVSLGADDATWCKCQPVRMPLGLRPGAGIQWVLFFNPAVLGGEK